MNTLISKLQHTDQDPWYWRLADVRDLMDIVDMARSHFQREMVGIFNIDEPFYVSNIDQAITEQRHYLSKQQLIVARLKDSNRLVAYAWIGRGTQTPYSQDEVAEARMLHIDLTESSRTRIKISAQALAYWESWCQALQIPVMVSTSIRSDQTAFMRLHEELGFIIRGSIAYKRLQPLKEIK